MIGGQLFTISLTHTACENGSGYIGEKLLAALVCDEDVGELLETTNVVHERLVRIVLGALGDAHGREATPVIRCFLVLKHVEEVIKVLADALLVLVVLGQFLNTVVDRLHQISLLFGVLRIGHDLVNDANQTVDTTHLHDRSLNVTLVVACLVAKSNGGIALEMWVVQQIDDFGDRTQFENLHHPVAALLAIVSSKNVCFRTNLNTKADVMTEIFFFDLTELTSVQIFENALVLAFHLILLLAIPFDGTGFG
mmetsp:Transcript_28333/g.71121  ORF Transcript_28333/g.71121 Transcript_28333/m.71121 type:complete len:252 (-) Transcript_28333:631-1386(-)